MKIAPIAAVTPSARASDPLGTSSGSDFGALLDDAAPKPAAPPKGRGQGTGKRDAARDGIAPEKAATPVETAQGKKAQAPAGQQAAKATAADTLPAQAGEEAPQLPGTAAPVADGEAGDPSEQPAQDVVSGDEATPPPVKGDPAAGTEPPATPVPTGPVAQAPAPAPANAAPVPQPDEAVQEDAPALAVVAQTDTPAETAPRKPGEKAQGKGAEHFTQAVAADAMPVPTAPVPQAAHAAAQPQDQGDAKLADSLADTPSAGTTQADPRATADAGAAAKGVPDGDARAPAPAHAAAGETMPSALLTQSLPGGVSRAGSFSDLYAAHQAQAAATTPDNPATIAAQPGRLGRDMGVEIARHVSGGRDEVFIRMDPADMGRVEVRLSFDRDHNVRAVVAADNQGTLNLLKREAGDLARALTDAGVRSDSQSFRFDSRGGEGGQTPWQQARQDGGHGRDTRGGQGGEARFAEDQPAYRSLRASGHIDLMA